MLRLSGNRLVMLRPLLLRFCLALSFALSSAAIGCAQHRIPAIDPSGNRLFSGTTTLATHDWLGGLFHKGPAAAPIAAGPAPAPLMPPRTPPVEAIPVVPG